MSAAEGPQGIFRSCQEADAADAGCIGNSDDAAGAECDCGAGWIAKVTTTLNPLTGAEFVVPALANPRLAAFTLPALSRAEATDAHRDLVRRLGAARDALWIPELGNARAETNRRAIWGAVDQPGEEAAAARGSFALLNRSFRIIERL